MAGRKGASKWHSPEERFWVRVNIPVDPDACWEWIGSKASSGYGSMMIDKKDNYLVHRFSWELHHGPIPDGMFICHQCDNPLCVNPNHLFCGTPLDNMRDMIAKGRQVRIEPPHLCGEDHPRATLTQEQVNEMRSLYASGNYTIADLALRYDTTRSNANLIVLWRSWRTLDSPPPEYPGRTKLTEDDVRAIRAEYSTGKVLQRELAARYDVTPSLISGIVNRKRWAHVA